VQDADPDSRAALAARHFSSALLDLAQATRVAALTGPTIWAMLGHFHALGVELPKALRQLNQCLDAGLREQQLEDTEGRDPAEAVAAARGHLERAAALCSQIGNELASAQHALRNQAAVTSAPSKGNRQRSSPLRTR
jgi:hypothetical protein